MSAARARKRSKLTTQENATLADWQDRWKRLQDKHRTWAGRLGTAEAAYLLPEAVVEALRKAPSKPLIGEQDAEAEAAFRALCHSYHFDAIGVWSKEPVRSHLLTDLWSSNGEAPNKLEGVMKKRVDSSHVVMLTYAGALTVNDEYQDNLRELRDAWDAVPESSRSAGAWTMTRVTRSSARVDGYYRMLDAFCRKWQLNHLLTWDIPVPQGPLIGAPVDAIRTQFGPDTLVDYYPPYWPTRRTSAEQIQETKADWHIRLGVTDASESVDLTGRGGAPSVYHSAMGMWIIELTVRRRYGLTRGLAQALITAFKSLTGRSEGQVKRIRQLYATRLPS